MVDARHARFRSRGAEWIDFGVAGGERGGRFDGVED